MKLGKTVQSRRKFGGSSAERRVKNLTFSRFVCYNMGNKKINCHRVVVVQTHS